MATLRSSRDMYKHTDYLIEDSSYRVVSGGLWRDPEWKFSNDLGPSLLEVMQPAQNQYDMTVDPYEEGNEIIFENPGSQPSFTGFDRNIPGNLVMPDAFIGYSSIGEHIANTDSITTTRQFTTEEEAINYLDQLSSNDI